MEDNTKVIPIVLSTLGIIFIMAMAFGLMATKYALFAAIVCFILAGTARRLLAVRR